MYRSVVGFGCPLLCFQNYNNCPLTFSWPSSLPSPLPSPSSLNYKGPYDPTTATSMKTSLKNRLRILSLFSRLFQGTQLLKRREFGLELKRRDRAQVLTGIVQFIGLPFPFPNWVISRRSYADCKEMYKKSVMHVQSCCFAH